MHLLLPNLYQVSTMVVKKELTTIGKQFGSQMSSALLTKCFSQLVQFT